MDDQKGDYEFWTLESECKPIPGRYLAGNNPAARFRDLKRQRHEHPLYEKAWQCAHTAKLIRYARKEEVEGWLTAHQEDTNFATRGAWIGGEHFDITKVAEVYRLTQRS